jgi:hypothetical protein
MVLWSGREVMGAKTRDEKNGTNEMSKRESEGRLDTPATARAPQLSSSRHEGQKLLASISKP